MTDRHFTLARPGEARQVAAHRVVQSQRPGVREPQHGGRGGHHLGEGGQVEDRVRGDRAPRRPVGGGAERGGTDGTVRTATGDQDGSGNDTLLHRVPDEVCWIGETCGIFADGHHGLLSDEVRGLTARSSRW